jgi:hypothetical protein
MSGAIPHSPNMPSWHGAQLKHRENFTFSLLVGVKKSQKSRRLRQVLILEAVSKKRDFY